MTHEYKQGIDPCTSVKAAVADVDYVVTSLPRTTDVEHVLLSEDGIFASAKQGTFICDSSTISPIAAKEFSAKARENLMTYCDAPMSGGTVGAAAGTLTFMVGAHGEEDFEKAKVVLSGMGKNIIHCGDPGTGEIAKLSNNLILAIQMIAVSEGIALGERLGIDPKKLQEILSKATASCWANNVGCPRPGVLENSPSSRNYDGGFQAQLMRKDLSLALECFEAVNLDCDFTKAA